MRILIILTLTVAAFAYGWMHQVINGSPNYSSTKHRPAISTEATEWPDGQKLSSEKLNFVCDRRSDSLELVKFYNATGGQNWINKWDLNKSIDSWFGIGLNNEGCVKYIDMDGRPNGIKDSFLTNNLTGSLISLNLSQLEELILPTNKISGSIPNFNNLPNLQILDVSSNLLSGTIPNFDKLPILQSINLELNQLSGTIPNFDKLPNLQILVLNSSQLSGPIPNFDKLPSLQLLQINNTQLSGTIPNFDKLPNLQFLQIVNTQLSGTIPGFDKLPNLKTLSLVGNQLSGKIPDFENLPNLEILILGNTELSGPIPNFSKTPLLKALSLQNNLFDGNIPNFSNLPKLVSLELDENNLSGNLPNFNLPSLSNLQVTGNKLSGNLPDFSNLVNLFGFYGYSNNFEGPIPSFNNNPKLQQIELYDNKLTGAIPSFTNQKNLTALFLYNNNLSGVIPNFFKNISKLTRLSFQNNKFTFKDIISDILKINQIIYSPQQKIYSDTTILITPNTTYTLDLLIDDTVTTSTYTWYKNGILYKTIKGSNKLPFTPFTSADAGTYTVKITNPLAPQLTLESWPIRLNAGPSLVCDRRSDSLELKKFYDSTGGANWFTKWNLSEPMDKWWGIKLSPTGCVTEINMSDSVKNHCCSGNNLNGSLPDLILSELQLLYCQNDTGLRGRIPNFNMPNLIEMSLPTCSLSGSIPNFDKLPKLKILNLNRNNLSGSLPDFKNLNNLEYLNLGVNSFSGQIPNFPSFQKLINLELYSNLLTGTIPNFSSLNNLNLLYLQSNQLSGKIPNFTNLRSLMFLGLDNNKLTGQLPSFEFTPNLKVVGITNNLLNGLFPDYSRFTPELTSMTIDRNCYTFSGITINIIKTQGLTQKNILPNCQCPDSLVYHPQKNIYVDTTITIPSCTDYTLDLKIDDTVTSSTYSWFKDGVPFISIKGSNKLSIKGFNSTNTGTYTVKITNPLAPQLTLESHPIRLISSGTAPQINNPRDTALSCGSFYILPTLKGINLTGNGLYFSGPGKSGMSYKPGDKIISTTTLYAFDGSGSCFDEDTFTISFSIKPAFILKPDQYKVPYNQSILFDVLANDFIPPGLNVMVVIDNPVHGKSFYSQTSGKGTYTPDLGFIGKEILKYKVCPVSCPNVCDSSTVEFDVLPPCSDRNSLVLPNVIFPEGPSNDNRYFIVQALIDCPDDYGPKPTKLTVFNRWGDLVYRNDAYINDWAGTNTQGQPLPTGTYYYLLDLGSVSAPIKGYVVIMR
ncbi:MAG: gliding motility-associated C-terminal domain-containing protein [Saprospiraceae bacterium]|nr:gliding motility-associated C-terminal domain-containing protein [Saprospiraceae bacterium]